MSNPSHELGYGGAALPISVEELYERVDALLLQRKGRLILLASQQADREALAWLCREYYESRSYDPIPTLVHALAQAYRDHPALAEHCPLAVVLRGLDLSMVGTDQAVVRLMRYGVVRDLFNAQSAQTGFRVAMMRQPTSPQIAPVYSAQWRLVTGDTLLFTVQGAASRIGPAALRRVMRLAGAAPRAATLLARLPHVPGGAPLIVLQQGQLLPVPEMPGAKPPPEAERPGERPRRHGWSPIWAALIILLATILAVVWTTGVHLDVEGMQDYLLMVFFPPATPTPSPESETPEQVAAPAEPLPYRPPALISPYPGARVRARETALIWEWEGELGPGEFFEVILRPPANEPEARTLTRVARHTATIGPDGWYAWSVRIVDGEDRENVRPLSPEAEPISFHWQRE